MTHPSPWVSKEELCEDLDCTQRTLRRYKARRLIPGLVEVGGKRLVSRVAWERAKAGLPPVPPEVGHAATT